MADGFNVFVDSAWWKECDGYVGGQVEAQCAELQHTVLKPDAKTTLASALKTASLVVLDLYRNGTRVQEVLTALSGT
jgi:hypothetical protein